MKNLYRQAVGQVIREHRTKQGRIMREVCAVAGIALGYLSEVERGIKEPSSEVILSIAEALNVPVWQIVREAAEVMEFREVAYAGLAGKEHARAAH